MKKTILLLAAMMSLSVSAQQNATPHSDQRSEKWTLEDCIRYAIENNITLKKSQLSKQTATETLKQSKAALFPSLTAQTNQTLGYRPWTDEASITVTDGQVDTKTEKTYYNGSYGVNAQWTVWNGNQNYNQVKLNRVSEEKAALAVEETANTIQESIAKLYVQILYQTEAIEVNRQSLETSKKNEERGQAMMEVGKMSKADVAQLTAQRATDEYNLVNAESQLANFKMQLKQQLELTTEDFDVAVPATSDEQAAGWLPTLSLTAGVSTSTTSLNDTKWGDQMRNKFAASGGLGVSIPIFDQRKARTAVNKAKIQQLTADLDLLDKQKALWKSIEGFWLDAQTNQQKFRSALISVESEQTSYDLLSEQFQLGLKNIVELMTGKDKLLKAQQNKLQSKYTTILNQQLLKFYQGEMMKI